MIAQKHKIIALFILALSHVVIAQPIDEESNWYREIGRNYDGYSGFDFTRYTQNEIQAAKSKYLQIESDTSLDEWEGLYARETTLGKAELIWSRRHGFVYDYVYHKLASIDYGRVESRGDSVFLVSERPGSPKPNRFLERELVRVKFGERHLMVAKTKLKDFAVFAAGLEIAEDSSKVPHYTEQGYVWLKAGDEDKKIADLPIYPQKYARLIPKPLQAKVLSVGRLRISRTTSPRFSVMAGDHLRSFTLSGGSRNGVKVGMTFWIDELEERVEIIGVRAHRSIARLRRPFIDGKEFCRNDEIPDGEPFTCREPKPGMRARTKTPYF